MKKEHFITLASFVLLYITSHAQTITTFTLNSGVTSTTLTAPMAAGDSVILKSGSLPTGYTVAITSYTTVVNFPAYDVVFSSGNSLNDSGQFLILSSYTTASIYITTNSMVGMNLTAYDSNGTPSLYWLITNGNIATGISESSSENFNPIIYPNPAKDYFSLKLKGEEGETVILNLYNSLGANVLNETYNEAIEPHNINIENFPSGIYSLEVICGSKKNMKKFVKM
jgi:hypothetical protein